MLAYIRSTIKRFKVFVTNRVPKIQGNSDVNQSNYVKGKDNPADDTSIGLDPKRRLKAVDGSLDLHSCGKGKNFGQVIVR